MLQLNTGPVPNQATGKSDYHFNETGRLSGVYATDWSWGALIADLDNDGWKDIFVANGMLKDVTDQDAMKFGLVDSAGQKVQNLKKIVDMLDTNPISNYIFTNQGDLTFRDVSQEWGMDTPGFSNGAVYADLDNDGDLDIITNNINEKASLYRNDADVLKSENHFLQVMLEGPGKNKFGIGAKVTAYYNQSLNYQELIPSRGFQSSVDYRLHFGLGKSDIVDSVVVEWPGGRKELKREVDVNQVLVFDFKNSVHPSESKEMARPDDMIFKPSGKQRIDFSHKEDTLINFGEGHLAFFKQSTRGPRMARGDVNGDGLDDLFIGGSSGQQGAVFMQLADGRFIASLQREIFEDAIYNDSDALLLDVDGDDDLDLIVGSGEYAGKAAILTNRLYLNNGTGAFSKVADAMPGTVVSSNTATIQAADYDNDGDPDLLVATASNLDYYGSPATSYLLENDGTGKFTNMTSTLARGLEKLGMANDAGWLDYDQDGRPDIVITGDYMPIRIFRNTATGFEDMTIPMGLDSTHGWWNRLVVCDLNNDGFPDLVAGNHGLNSRFKASPKKPATLYVSDFDLNGAYEQILCTYNGEKQYPMVLLPDLVSALPHLNKKYPRHIDYQGQTMEDIFGAGVLKESNALDVYTLRTAVFINDKKGGFTMQELPLQAQFSPVYGIAVHDFNSDGKQDILLGGNFYESKPETGIYDGSYGLLLTGDGQGGFNPVSYQESGFFVQGAIRDFEVVRSGNQNLLIVSRNNDGVVVMEF
ncbi:MAG: VCBS repeat-containing protein [Cyclobacteriaceae bacterium]|nr:VCBS repeat-containing protein [Cyclobacteriaceae bacterium]